MKIQKRNRKGMTLIEVIVTLAISAIAIQVLYSIFFSGTKSFEFSKKRGFAQQDVRLAADFINSELRYIDQLDDEPLEGKYYSLEIKTNEADDGTYSLEKREYGGENPLEGTHIRSINGKGFISIKNKVDEEGEGKIISTFEESGYKPIFKLALVNKPKLRSGVEISSNSENERIYYSINSDNFSIAGGMDGPGDTGDPVDPGDTVDTVEWVKGNSYKMGDRVKHGGKLYEVVKEDKANLEYHAPASAEWVYQIWREISELWLELNVYYKDDVVLYNDKIYIAKQQTQKNMPGKIDWAWEEIPRWQQDKKYVKGDKIWYNRNVYQAQKNVNASNPNESGNDWKKIS